RCFLVFFFQAEDGIRDWSVTGVQTCALPISAFSNGLWIAHYALLLCASVLACSFVMLTSKRLVEAAGNSNPRSWATLLDTDSDEIGRASCRERGDSSVGAGEIIKKRRVRRRR